MMPGLSVLTKSLVLYWMFKQTIVQSPPITLFYSLHGSPPDDSGSGELGIADTGYLRAELDPDINSGDNTNYGPIAFSVEGATITNLQIISWPESGGLWNGGNPIPYWGIWTTQFPDTSGFLFGGTISGELPIIGSAQRMFEALPGQLIVTIGVC